MMVTLCLNILFYKLLKSALLNTFLVMFLQSFAFMHNILLIIANHDWVCRFKMLVFVYILFIGFKLSPMT
jgi:hypothetical protein